MKLERELKETRKVRKTLILDHMTAHGEIGEIFAKKLRPYLAPFNGDPIWV